MMGGPVVKDVVLVGAGHAHVQVLRRFGMRPIPGVRFTLITRELHTPYSGMLPGLVAGRYGFDEAHIDTGPLARFAGARLYADEVVGLDLAERRVLCRARPPVPYDLLSINIGSRPNTGDVPGAAAHAIPVKPIDGFLARFEALKARVLAGRSRHVLLVGGGAGGVELLLSVERRLRRELDAAGGDSAALRFTLVAGADGLLPRFPRAFRHRFKAVMAARGITLAEGARVAAVEAGAVVLGDGARLGADEILWTTEAAPARWLAETGLALDDRGFLRVDAKLRARGRDDVFAAGDTIAFDPVPIPRSGVYSVRAGPVLADNIRAALTGRRLRPYRPQRDALYIVSTGEPHAIATRNGLTVAGAWVWRWKDWIDRRFMRRFNELPEMTQALAGPASPLADTEALREISAIAMRCGGCGAKVGATVLTRALGAIQPAPNPDVLVGLDAPDDAAVVDSGGTQLAVHTVDYFRAIVDDPYRFGMIAANHALGDLYAMGAAPHTALAIATVPYGLEAKVEADLAAMMAGANAVLREAGCALVGGHTSEGAELALGFALNGLAARERVLRKGGLRPGDALILTKPIGTGTLLAGQMRGLARARWVEAALAQMCVSNRRAGAILAAHGASAMTDVTGFGLLGHLVEMTRASGVDAHLVLERIPVLEGARETVARGVFSSLQPQNLRLRRAVRDLAAAQALPLYPLLFDPQTAGGLLAGVPVERAAACLAALRDAGYAQAAVIGRVAPRSDTLEPITLGARGDPLDDVAVPEAADARSVAEPARSG
jgi:selenide,water dikinase